MPGSQHENHNNGAPTEQPLPARDHIPATAARRELLISKAFVALADTLVEGYDVIDLLDRLAGYSVALLAADSAAIMLADGNGQLRAVASSREDADLMDLLQLQTGQGPCVDSYTTCAPVSVTDLDEAAHRWPDFTAALESRGTIRSVHALPLRLRGTAIGALNLFHHYPAPLPAEDLALGQALADVATIAILSERSTRASEIITEQLQTALNSRVVIEQAKGIIANALGISTDQAFQVLRRYVRNRNEHISDTAHLFATGQLDPRTLTSPATAPKRASRSGNQL